MDQNPSCPACRASDWEPLADRVYQAADLAALPPPKRLMMSVLFEKWQPGSQRVQLKLEGCRRCGMVIYTPRPTDADVEAKYRFLNSAMADATPSKDEPAARMQQRSNRLMTLVRRHLAKPVDQLRVLDFGGGDGRLMRRFIEGGAKCELIDYTNRPVPGVTKVGDDQASLTDAHRYDLIVCSHVVEHLASPLDVLSQLRSHLTNDGVIYIEVPLEIYRDLPIKTDPVTHVNFFTPASLRKLLDTSGFGVRNSHLTYYPHPKGGWKIAVSAIADSGTGGAAKRADAGTRELKNFLNPSVLTRLGMKAVMYRDQYRFKA